MRLTAVATMGQAYPIAGGSASAIPRLLGFATPIRTLAPPATLAEAQRPMPVECRPNFAFVGGTNFSASNRLNARAASRRRPPSSRAGGATRPSPHVAGTPPRAARPGPRRTSVAFRQM